ncbi:AI-2E family transporter [Catellatospora tritici]|uniref:AI-2E family transporter n=1 Tax=Catellatospora tritici TaxID=2851566 RepID=UPI001C2D125F|nr:AI-2E family transporter [Catellatospora tritici]MBV1853710.1 AI-2E family transporter [Catellatospora tritici]
MDSLRSTGAKAWSMVGIGLVAAAVIFLIVLLKLLAIALGAALCVSLALSPAVDALARRGLKRALLATLSILLLIGVAIGVFLLVVKGLASQWSELSTAVDKGIDRLHQTLASLGMKGSLAEAARKSLSTHSSTLLSGLGPEIGRLLGGIASLFIIGFVFLFTTFFMLKDGPYMARAAGPWVPLGPAWLAQVGRIIRGYVVGLTLLGAFNAAVVALGAFALGVPLIGTLIVVTLLGNYVPYLGAWVAGAYAVLIALGAGGAQTALIMIVVVCLANGALQTMLQPFAYGAALRMHPLTILLATVVGGLLAGIIGVMIAAPVAAIIQHTAHMLREGRAAAAPPDRAPKIG